MPKIVYESKGFSAGSLALIDLANGIIADYQAQGFSLTLRQLYYQLVSRGHIPNRDTEYKRLGSIINDARLAGLVDWLAIEDRTRHLRENSHWRSPAEIVQSAIHSYRIDKWEDQPYHAEVWIEKDALVGVISGVCSRLDVAYFSCRGYTSASEMWLAGQRLKRANRDNGKDAIVLHLGDHDPSGIDMTRDITDRLRLFSDKSDIYVKRIALTMEQIEQYNPPPNPAKTTDSRYQGYIEQYGNESWELDALEPAVLTGLIEDEVLTVRDDHLWGEAVRKERGHIAALKQAAEGLAL